MPFGTATALHLAANLLALAAAAGLSLTVWAGPRSRSHTAPPGRTGAETLVAFGALVIAVGHALGGALIDPARDVVAWLLAAGLVLVAVGLAPQRLRALHLPAVALPAAALPVAPLPAAALGAAAGLFAGIRALFAGRSGALLGSGLVLWGVARGLDVAAPSLAPWATTAGALAVAGWLWQANAVRLLARLVTAFVLSLLVVVVVLAVVLSTIGAAGLIDEELRGLEASSADIATTVADEWPREAIDTATILGGSADTLAELVRADSRTNLRGVLAAFGTQDFLTVLSADGRVLLSAGTVDVLETAGFLLALPGAEPVERVVGGDREGGGLITYGGQVVALGAVRIFDQREFRAEDPPRFIVVTGRIADDVWASRVGSQLNLELVVEVGGHPSATSEGAAAIGPREILEAHPPDEQQAALRVDGASLFAGATPIVDPRTQSELGRVVTVSSGEALAQLERDQARQLFLIALGGSLVAGLIATVVASRLVAPIRRLTAAAVAVREGDLQVTAQVESPDEIGELGRTFDEMTFSLSEQSAKLREAAEEQARLRARLEAMTESMGDALVAVDVDGKVVTFNPAAEQLVGRESTQVIGLPLERVLVGQADDGSVAATLGGPTSEHIVATQVLLDSGNGRLVPTAATAAPVRNARGEVLGRVLVLRDISREAEIERMKTEFLSNVSHELRTPLTPIKGYAEVLANRDVDTLSAREYAGQILESTKRLERVVATIVDFAALDSGRMQPQPECTPVDDLVGAAVERWRERMPGRAFRRRVASGLPPVYVDGSMVQRCLDELVDNAVKFSPEGAPVIIGADFVRDRRGEVWVRLSVKDRGVGMEPDAAARVFADFYQVDASETRAYGGLGLGLALVRRIVDVLDGDATIESELGEGTTVHVLLPPADT